MDILATVKDIVVGVSALAVAVVAIKGLQTWRRELAGKAQFEVARKLIVLGNEIRQDFARARSPFTRSWEFHGRARQDEESETKALLLNEWFAHENRLTPLREHFVGLQEVGWEVDAVFDASASGSVGRAIETYRVCHGELAATIEGYFSFQVEAADHEISEEHGAWLKGLRPIIYSREDDDFSRTVHAATEELIAAVKQSVR